MQWPPPSCPGVKKHNAAFHLALFVALHIHGHNTGGATRTNYKTCTLIDNIFINIYNHDFSVHPLINGLSDHDGQIITFSNVFYSVPRHMFSISRKINTHTIRNFTLLLIYENWEDVFLEKDVNILFNNFLNTYLRIFYASFPNVKTKHTHNQKPWITSGIRISCTNKRKLYLTCRQSNNSTLKEHYKAYWQTLSKVIMLAKNLYYNNLINNLIINQKQLGIYLEQLPIAGKSTIIEQP